LVLAAAVCVVGKVLCTSGWPRWERGNLLREDAYGHPCVLGGML
jgi:hypothetical protein